MFKKKKGVGYLLILLRLVFAALAALFAGYGIITQEFRLSPYIILFLGLALLVMGLEEFRKKRKVYGSFCIVVFLFSLYVSIEGII
ncbi:YczI family protein [Sporosarcina sp. P16b]|uniref:YczI family protein n=1 Tax=Sporosarcina sp. P16b TaxID=2048261 RepID=UPI001E415C8E|nr:YczI family protein [Sporosarcina sp. P16b]